jgi:L-2-hydroxycarboxylate dehydrogenase (NAD+)
MKITVTRLRELTRDALRHYGYSEPEVSLMSDVLLYAQLRNNTQGIAKLVGQGLPKDPEAGEMQVVKETKLSALLDGSHNPGIVVMMRAVDMTLEKARNTGFGVVGTFNTHSSTGAIGYYARKIANTGFIGVASSGSPMTVSMHGSFEPIFGTNPLAFGIPSDSDPVVFDMATSAISWYGLVEASAAGNSIPDDVAYDAEGNPTTDPDLAMEGAIRPFDRGPKGTGLSMIVEVLTGPLVGAAFVGIGDDWGNLVVALDPGLLVSPDKFRRDVSQLVERMKKAERLPRVTELVVPGERGDVLSRQRLDADEIGVDDNLLRELERVAASN